MTAYSNLKYLVIVGDDRSVPYRRVCDEALYANERTHATSIAPHIAGSLAERYFLSDDYYAGMLSLPYRGYEFYLPQYASGRLVENRLGSAWRFKPFLIGLSLA